MVAGHLQEKRGTFHIVINYNDEYGKRRSKWKSTGLPVKGNKKRAEEMLLDARKSFVPPNQIAGDSSILFTDFLEEWVEIAKSTVDITTYASYKSLLRKPILPYFKKKGLTLEELHVRDIQAFYTKELKRVKANTVIHYHAVIHKALKYAVKVELINSNPAGKVERPKIERFVSGFYNKEEIAELFKVAAGSKLEIPVLLGSVYGLRRSEVIGLKWDSIDFENNTITIEHTVTSCNLDNKHIIVAKDRAKTKSSLRTLPLIKEVRDKLIRHYNLQVEYKKLCGRSYNKKYQEYICVNEVGDLIKPNYITNGFRNLLIKNDLKRIRFHDLRHSCGSLLLANNVPMKQIQEWLGHSDFATTANIYAHLEYKSKIVSADALAIGLNLDTTIQNDDTVINDLNINTNLLNSPIAKEIEPLANC